MEYKSTLSASSRGHLLVKPSHTPPTYHNTLHCHFSYGPRATVYNPTDLLPDRPCSWWLHDKRTHDAIARQNPWAYPRRPSLSTACPWGLRSRSRLCRQSTSSLDPSATFRILSSVFRIVCRSRGWKLQFCSGMIWYAEGQINCSRRCRSIPWSRCFCRRMIRRSDGRRGGTFTMPILALPLACSCKWIAD